MDIDSIAINIDPDAVNMSIGRNGRQSTVITVDYATINVYSTDSFGLHNNGYRLRQAI
jgi:hypothetical protein